MQCELVSDVVVLADEYWEFFRDAAQLWNLDRGDVDQIERWEDFSPDAVAARIARLGEFEHRAERLSAGVHDARDAALVSAVAFSARASAAMLHYDRDLSYVAGPFNLATLLSVYVPGYALVTAEHGRGYIAKVKALPSFIDAWIAGVRDGVAAGRVATARGIVGTADALHALLSTDVNDDPLLTQPPPREASSHDADEWRNDVRDAVRDAARPAMARFEQFLRTELLPAARTDDKPGVCHLPGGAEDYQQCLLASTSMALTPDAVHALGLERLALLDDEYRRLGPSTVGIDDPAQVRERLRADRSLRYASRDEIVHDAMAALARAEAEAPRWFNRLPRARCTGVAAESGAIAFYSGPSPDGVRGGTFFFNASDPSTWSRYQLEVTTFHESVPGHHLHVALAMELDLHPVVGELEVTSLGEGWGLYAERLADEMDLYSSPLQRVGMLTLDSLRAARLVVDTGLHAMGWTRDSAIDVLRSHTALDDRLVEAEIDRYIAFPGQATSYMVGRLEIQRLRRLAERRLGARFSIREFHDVVLGSGMIPLPTLARTVDAWLDPSTTHQSAETLGARRELDRRRDGR